MRASGGIAMVAAMVMGGMFAAGAARADNLPSGTAQKVASLNRYLDQVPIDESLRKNPPVSKLRDIENAVGDAENRLMFAHGTWRKIPANYHGHPDVVKVKKRLERADKYVADLKANIDKLEKRAAEEKAAERAKAEAEDAAVRAEQRRAEATAAAERDISDKALHAFMNDYLQYRERIEWMKDFYDDPAFVKGYGDNTIAEAKKAFADIHAGCTGKHKAIADPAIKWNAGYRPWCEMAAQGDAMLKRMVLNWVKDHAKVIADSFRKQDENLASSNGRLKDWNISYYANPDKVKKELLARYAPDAKAVGITLPDDLFADADAALAALLPKIEEASKSWKFDPYGKPGKDNFVKKSYEKAWGAKVKKIYFTDKGWRVYVDHRRKPQYRTRRGTVLFQVKGEPWCHSQEFYVVQDAKGRGFGKSYFEHPPTDGMTTIVRCK